MLQDEDSDRSEAYKTLAGIFSGPPDAETLTTLKEDLELDSKEREFEVVEDFDQLFSHPDGRVPPLESHHVYSQGNGTDEAVEAFYEEAELTVSEEYDLPPGHISLELLFMSYLIDTGRLDVQRRFLGEHIMKWVPHFCDEVISSAKTLFYKEIAGIMKEFITNEYESFE